MPKLKYCYSKSRICDFVRNKISLPTVSTSNIEECRPMSTFTDRSLYLQCCVSSKRIDRHTYNLNHGSDFEAMAPSKEGSYDDSTFSSRGASGDNSPGARVRHLNSHAAGHKSNGEPQVRRQQGCRAVWSDKTLAMTAGDYRSSMFKRDPVHFVPI